MKIAFTLIIAAIVAALPCNARDIQMVPGRDTYVFDFPNYNGRTISVYQIDENESYSDRMEGLMHDRFILEDILKSVSELREHPLAFWNGRSLDPSVNGFAAIRFNNRRYIVLNPSWVIDHYARIFVLSHELGHHVCGHTAGMMTDRAWDRELEADQFAGMVIRAMERDGALSAQQAIGGGIALLNEQGSASHPPRAMRLSATMEGYNNGSPCVGRHIASGNIASTGTYSGVPIPFWDHNGSMMKLIANGANRRFIYENPRAGLKESGIQSGSILFQGKRSGNTYSGTAYVYSRKCAPLAFQVSGTVASDQRAVTMYGKAPQRTGNGCGVAGYRNETLTFTYLGQ